MWSGWPAQLRRLDWTKEPGADLRKTARGASSPAKPALHMPELEGVSSHVSGCFVFCSAAGSAVGTRWDRRHAWAEPNRTPLARRSGFGIGAEAYPLSITRAATSSVASCQHPSRESRDLKSSHVETPRRRQRGCAAAAEGEVGLS